MSKREALAEAHANDVEVGARERGLLAERRGTLAQMRQRGAQIGDQVVEHLAG